MTGWTADGQGDLVAVLTCWERYSSHGCCRLINEAERDEADVGDDKDATKDDDDDDKKRSLKRWGGSMKYR